MKKENLKKLLVTLGVVGVVTVASATGSKCGIGKVKLNTKDNVVCLDKAGYKNLKKSLKDEYKKPKSYDFEIKNRELLIAVLNRELELNPLSLDGNVTKERIRTELLKLLNE